MGRFDKNAGKSGFSAPDVTPDGAIKLNPETQRAETHERAQTPVRKTEGGRYSDEDYAEMRKKYG